MTKNPGKNLEEIIVQRSTQTFLNNYYRKKHGKRSIYSNIEESTKKIHGMKRADGLLAYKQNRKKAYVISMEAKSHKTLPSLKPYRLNSLWIRDSLWKAFLFTLGSGVFFLAFQSEDRITQFVLPSLIFFSFFLLHMILFSNSLKYKEIKVLHQLFQYPANEQWLSFSRDSFDMIEEKMRKNLIKICSSRGTGVLIVDFGLNVNLIHPPKPRKKLRGDFLTYYHNEAEIRDFLKMR